MKTYAIACTSRSGSSWLCELIDSTGLAGSPDEYFTNASEPFWRDKFSATNLSTDEYIERLQEMTSNGDHFGYKTACTATIDRCPPQDVIFLRRKNVTRQAISFYRATEGEAWRGPYPEDLEFDREAISKIRDGIISANGRWAGFLAARGFNLHRVWYENLCHDPGREVLRILKFLGAVEGNPSILVSSTIKKQADAITDEWERRFNGIHS